MLPSCLRPFFIPHDRLFLLAVTSSTGVPVGLSSVLFFFSVDHGSLAGDDLMVGCSSSMTMTSPSSTLGAGGFQGTSSRENSVKTKKKNVQ